MIFDKDLVYSLYMRAEIENVSEPEIRTYNVNGTVVRFTTWQKDTFARKMTISTPAFEINFDFQNKGMWKYLRQYPATVYDKEAAEATWMLMKILA